MYKNNQTAKLQKPSTCISEIYNFTPPEKCTRNTPCLGKELLTDKHSNILSFYQ